MTTASRFIQLFICSIQYAFDDAVGDGTRSGYGTNQTIIKGDDDTNEENAGLDDTKALDGSYEPTEAGVG